MKSKRVLLCFSRHRFAIRAKNEELKKEYHQGSVMYRSFLICDGPKGVVECGTIRKYRTRSHKVKDKTKIQKTTENWDTSLISKRYKEEKKVPKGCDRNLIGPSSLQLTQFSRGDWSSTNMLDSWSRDVICDEKSEDIVEGILQGTLDLQDSLTMLRKLQEETSPLIASFRSKQTKKPEGDRLYANMISRTQASPFGEQSNAEGFRRPKPSAGGSSSDCKEELKKVIKESLVRKNKVLKMTTEELDSGSETFSTRTSQYSGIRTNSLSDPSFSVIASMMERGPSLVFKLMGLEEAPSRSFPAVKKKQLDGEIDISKVRKYDSIAEKVNPEQKALKETLNTMHFKGILKERFVKETKLHVHHFNATSSKQFSDLSHMAFMKPQCILYQESEKSTYMSVPPKELPITRLKPETASSKTIINRKGSGSTNMGKEMQKGICKRVNKEEGPKFLKQVMKLDGKGINPVEESSGKVKLYCHIGHKTQENETIDKKWKIQTISKKQPERDISQPTILTRPQYQRKIPSTKLRNLKRRSRIEKNEISCLKRTGSNYFSTQNTNNSKDLIIYINYFFYSVIDSLIRRKNHLKNRNPIAEPEPAKLTVEEIWLGEENKNYGEISALEEEFLMVCEEDAYINKIGEKCKQRKGYSGDDITMLKSEHENDGRSADEEGTELKHFLLTSPSFIGHAKKLFNFEVDCPNSLQKEETMANVRLYLDLAYELTERKSLQESQVVRSLLLACGDNSRLHISSGRSVEEICNGIENLKFYKEDSAEEVFAGNDVFAMMEKDMKCNGEINSMWEKGWRLGFSADEAELVVNKIETLLVSGLIQELVINL
ncbi:hypothetical protein VNO78_10127 [Psophocarpus tetragonolobus]|uniref:DUF4378 domain-containing protein n=1 Tax=Psophocarpus tetragonolobus TaxID=3891 RepID=A0AAN9SQW4_PSOTE